MKQGRQTLHNNSSIQGGQRVPKIKGWKRLPKCSRLAKGTLKFNVGRVYLKGQVWQRVPNDPRSSKGTLRYKFVKWPTKIQGWKKEPKGPRLKRVENDLGFENGP